MWFFGLLVNWDVFRVVVCFGEKINKIEKVIMKVGNKFMLVGWGWYFLYGIWKYLINNGFNVWFIYDNFM